MYQIGSNINIIKEIIDEKLKQIVLKNVSLSTLFFN